MEGLEQPRPHIVAAERDLAELDAQLVGQHEAGVDDLAVLAVAKRSPVASASNRVLDWAEHRREPARAVVVERRRQAYAKHTMSGERIAQPSTRVIVVLVENGIEVVDLVDVERHSPNRTHYERR